MILFLLSVLVVAYEEELIFKDEFNEFDLSKWSHEITLGGNGNSEFQMYVNSRNNSFARNGTLFIKPSLTKDCKQGKLFYEENKAFDIWGDSFAGKCTCPQFYGCYYPSDGVDLPPVQSARISTAKSFSFKFGRVEVNAKLPSGDWLWPAIWLLPKDDAYGPWPSSGEIDIMESRGNGEGYSYRSEKLGNQVMSSCFHFGVKWNQDGCSVTVGVAKELEKSKSFADEFHIFGLYWDEYEMYTYLDTPDQVIARVKEYRNESFWDLGQQVNAWTNASYNVYQNAKSIAPFDQEMQIILNVAVGGISTAKKLPTGYFPDDVGNKPWKTASPHPRRDFTNSMQQWLPTWQHGQADISDEAALQIRSVKVWGFKNKTTHQRLRNPTFYAKDVVQLDREDKLPCMNCHGNTSGTCQDPETNVCYAKLNIERPCFANTKSCKQADELIAESEFLIFEDNFDTFDLKKWDHEITLSSSKHKFQRFENHQDTSFVKDGMLHIQPIIQNVSSDEVIDIWGSVPSLRCTNNANSGCKGPLKNSPIRSAKIRTANSFSLRYGRVEVKARLPKGSWLRPNIRMHAKYDSYGTEFPLSGMITLMEARKENNENWNSSSGFHYGSAIKDEYLNSKANVRLDGNIHTFGLYWDKKTMYTYADGKVLSTMPNSYMISGAPFDKEMYLSIGLPVGGTDGFFPDNTNSKPWKDSDGEKAASQFMQHPREWATSWNNSAFLIDSVRVWAIQPDSLWNYHSDFVPPMNIMFKDQLTRVGKVNPHESIHKPESWRFGDDFNDVINLTTWKPEITLNSELHRGFQMYSNLRQTSFTRNGKLYLRPMLLDTAFGPTQRTHGFLDMWGTNAASACTSPYHDGCIRTATPNDPFNPVLSSSLRTAESYSMKYGRIEIKVKLPKGKWLWPRIRLMPVNVHRFGMRYISLLECISDAQGCKQVYFGAHNAKGKPILFPHALKHGSYSDEFHTFGVVWESGKLVFYKDRPSNILKQISFSPGLYDQEMYLSIELAVAGIHHPFPHIASQQAPWSQNPSTARESFWQAKSSWYPSWTKSNKISDEASLQIDSINYWIHRDDSSSTRHRLVGDRHLFTFGGYNAVPYTTALHSNYNEVNIVAVSAHIINLPMRRKRPRRIAYHFRRFLLRLLQSTDTLQMWGIHLLNDTISATIALPKSVVISHLLDSTSSNTDNLFRLHTIVAIPKHVVRTKHYCLIFVLLVAFCFFLYRFARSKFQRWDFQRNGYNNIS